MSIISILGFPSYFANKYLLSEEDKIKYADEIKEYLNRK